MMTGWRCGRLNGMRGGESCYLGAPETDGSSFEARVKMASMVTASISVRPCVSQIGKAQFPSDLQRNRFELITLRTAEQIELIRRAGAINAEGRRLAAGLVRSGATTGEIAAAVTAFCAGRNATAIVSLSVNNEVMDAVPTERRLRNGDLVTVDIACRVDGWWADSAITLPVGEASTEAARLIAAAREALDVAIRQLGHAQRWNEVAAAIEQHVRNQEFHIVEQLGGHGIGREVHEDPQAPNRLADIPPNGDFELRPGLVLAIEPTVTAGNGRVVRHANGRTWLTDDGALSAHFEHTVALTDAGVEVLTADL